MAMQRGVQRAVGALAIGCGVGVMSGAPAMADEVIVDNLCQVANRIMNRDCRMVIVGDSITTKGNPISIGLGIGRTWAPRQWVGRVSPGNPQVDNTGLNIACPYADDKLRVGWQVAPGQAFSDGSVGLAPDYALDYSFDADYPDRSSLLTATLGSMGAYVRGDWTAGAPLTARMVYRVGPRTIPQVQIQSVRNNDYTLASTVQLSGPVDQTGWVESTMSDGYGPAQLVVQSAPDVDESGTNFYHYGTLFYRGDVAGFQFDSVSIGGWTAADQLDPVKCSDQQLVSYLAATRSPNLVMIWIGQNMTVDEYNIPGVWRSHVQGLIDRYRKATVAAGAVNPMFLLVAPYRANDIETRFDWMAEDLHTLSVINPNTGYINLCALAGTYKQMARNGYFRDGLHPSELGAVVFAKLLWQQIENAAAQAYIGDVNEDGAVNTGDLAALLGQFGKRPDMRGGGADLNRDGVVDTRDLAIVLGQYGAKCHGWYGVTGGGGGPTN